MVKTLILPKTKKLQPCNKKVSRWRWPQISFNQNLFNFKYIIFVFGDNFFINPKFSALLGDQIIQKILDCGCIFSCRFDKSFTDYLFGKLYPWRLDLINLSPTSSLKKFTPEEFKQTQYFWKQCTHVHVPNEKPKNLISSS